jgi:hypothetical protein
MRKRITQLAYRDVSLIVPAADGGCFIAETRASENVIRPNLRRNSAPAEQIQKVQVCFTPESGHRSFDHLVRARKQFQRHHETECLGRRPYLLWANSVADIWPAQAANVSSVANVRPNVIFLLSAIGL